MKTYFSFSDFGKNGSKANKGLYDFYFSRSLQASVGFKRKGELMQVLGRDVFRRKPEYLAWKKYLKKTYHSSYGYEIQDPQRKNSEEDLEKLRKIGKNLGYTVESIFVWYEVNFLRRPISLVVNPWKIARISWLSRPGCKGKSMHVAGLGFDTDFFFIDVLEKSRLIKMPEPKDKKEVRLRKKWDSEHKQLTMKFPEDAGSVWGTMEDEIMFYAIMTCQELSDLRKRAKVLRTPEKGASYGSCNEVITAKHFPEQVKKMEWAKMVLKAGLAGKDEKWLHAQFARWLESRLLFKDVMPLEKKWEREFISRPDDFGVPRPEMFGITR